MLLQDKVASREGEEQKLQLPKHRPLYLQICDDEGRGL